MYRSIFYGEKKLDRDKQNWNSFIIIITIAFFLSLSRNLLQRCKLIANEHKTRFILFTRSKRCDSGKKYFIKSKHLPEEN